MAQIFDKNVDLGLRAIGVLAPGGLITLLFAIGYWASPKYTDVGYRPEQPVPFSHALHAGELGMDCRYCHHTAERAAMAAIPATETCMNCHKFVRKDSGRLAPVRESEATGVGIPWTRVHMLPDYANFDHSAHLAAGVGCSSCHGRIDQMAVVAQAEPISMSWCLNCHRGFEQNLRPLDQITNMAWDPATADYDPHTDPNRTRKASELKPPQHCSGCHR